MRKVGKHQLCSSCLRIGSIQDCSIESILDSEGYNSADLMNIDIFNLGMYRMLNHDGGCSKCIHSLKLILENSGYSEQWLTEFITDTA